MDAECAFVRLLRAGEDDWVHAAELPSIVCACGENRDDEEAITRSCLAVIRRVLDEGIMDAGDLEERREGFFRKKRLEFVKWDVSLQEAFDLIERRWRDLGLPTIAGEVCWLQLTPKGMRRWEELGVPALMDIAPKIDMSLRELIRAWREHSKR